MSEEHEGEYSLTKIRAKLKPSRLIGILEAVDHIRDTRHTAWIKVMFRINKAVKAVLDEYGVVGLYRAFYYSYSKRLWKYLNKYPEAVWGKYIKATRDYYIDTCDLRADVLDKVAEAIVEAIKEMQEELARMEEEGDGGKGAEADNTG